MGRVFALRPADHGSIPSMHMIPPSQPGVISKPVLGFLWVCPKTNQKILEKFITVADKRAVFFICPCITYALQFNFLNELEQNSF